MSDPKDKAGQRVPDLTPQGNAPSWVDEVLGSRSTLSGPADLKLPQTPPPPPRPGDGWENVSRPQAQPAARTAPRTESAQMLRDFVQPLSSPEAEQHPTQRIVARPAPAPAPDAWGEMHPQPGSGSGESVSQKKLIAGLLAIFLGSLGIHKFYLGLNTPGLVLLGVNVGVWVLALVVGLLLFGVGLLLTLPLAGLVSSALAVLGLVEGIIYLTKSDADFEREYLINKKPWL